MLRWPFAFVLLPVMACVHVGTTPPTAEERAEFYRESREKVDSLLRAHLGQPFPNMTLTRRDGTTSMLSEALSRDIAIFYAGGPCPETVSWAGELDHAGWTLEGFPVIVVTYPGALTNPDLARALEKAPPSFSTDWPPPGYLHKNRFYPFVYFVDAAGRLKGYWWRGDSQPVWAQ